ncbi:MAG: hypothetical protein P3W87_001030 [Gammaproteobacteria bacterium]|nr:hypothetical protein [Gammaproteobacteria bacterium]
MRPLIAHDLGEGVRVERMDVERHLRILSPYDMQDSRMRLVTDYDPSIPEL